MTKDELTALVDFVNGSWNLTPFKDDLLRQKKTWYAYMHDLDFDAVMVTVSNLALTETFQPKPGLVRRRTMMPPVISAAEAWAELQTQRDAVYSGQMGTVMSEITQAVCKRLGDTVKGMHTNGDRDKFIETYGGVLEEMVQAKCGTVRET